MNKMINAWKSAVFENYVNFSGRLSVGGYWWFILLNILIIIGLLILTAVADAFVFLYIIFVLAMFLPQLGAAVRRLHDTGKSGWMMLISFIPLVGPIILIVFLASSGDSGQNSYGPPPAPVTA